LDLALARGAHVGDEDAFEADSLCVGCVPPAGGAEDEGCPPGEKSGSKSVPRPERVTRRRPLPLAFITQISPPRVLYAILPCRLETAAGGIAACVAG
jgi:hypothetical protein